MSRSIISKVGNDAALQMLQSFNAYKTAGAATITGEFYACGCMWCNKYPDVLWGSYQNSNSPTEGVMSTSAISPQISLQANLFSLIVSLSSGIL